MHFLWKYAIIFDDLTQESVKTMTKSLVKTAFIKSLPVMAGYIVLGIGFGILLNEAGFGPVWALLFTIVPLGMVVYFAFTNADGGFTFSNITEIGNYAKTYGVSIWLGFIGYPMWLFLGVSAIFRTGRFAIIATLLYFFQERANAIVNRYFWPLTIGAIVAAILGIGLVSLF